jgi:LysM repeat protein
MKIRTIFIALLTCLSVTIWAQTPLHVQGMSPNLYLNHTVVVKDNWYSIGRLYNLSPKELAPFNDLPMDKPLEIGQQLRIPLTATNFSQDNQKLADEVFVPVYYVVKEREWMYRISQNNNKVPIEKLEQWNNLTNGDIKPGLDVIVGYLKIKSSQSPLAAHAAAVRTSPAVAKTTEPVQKSSEPLATNKPEEKNVDPAKEKVDPTKEKIADLSKSGAVIVESKTEDRVITEKPETKPTETKALDTKPAETKPTVVQASVDNRGGYFKSQYGESGRSASGAAGVFRSNSGWQDGKYYALMNNIPVGTISK